MLTTSYFSIIYSFKSWISSKVSVERSDARSAPCGIVSFSRGALAYYLRMGNLAVIAQKRTPLAENSLTRYTSSIENKVILLSYIRSPNNCRAS